MLLIRRMEERLGEVVKSGELPGSVHLYIGQEAVAVGVCAQLAEQRLDRQHTPWPRALSGQGRRLRTR